MGTPSLLATAITAGLELAVNQSLRLDPGSQQQLRQLNHKVLVIEVTQPQIKLYVRLGYPVALLNQYEAQPGEAEPANCTLKGTALGFLALAQGGYHNLAKAGIEQHGDMALLSQILAIARNLDLDWEAVLVKTFGNLGGHSLASIIHRQHNWFSATAGKVPFFVGDYLTHELGLIPGAAEIAGFCQDVDELRSDCDRLEARIRHLIQLTSPTLSA